MRVSDDPSDRGYHQASRLGLNLDYVRILIDGDPTREVITADEEAGLALIGCLDDEGGPVMLRNRVTGHRRWKMRWVRGVVRVIPICNERGEWPHGITAPRRLRSPP